MKPVLKYSLIAIVVAGLIYLGLGYLSSMVGWYGYKKWEYRKASQSIKESKERGVFKKALHFEVENPLVRLDEFEAFIERGFKYGYHSINETRDLGNSGYPYQLSFKYQPDSITTVLIRADQLIKFDSAGPVWGYLKNPVLSDTIILIVYRKDRDSALIKVWN